MGMESHALDVWPAPLEPPEPLPRGPHSLPRDVVVRSQRTRMLRALIEVVAEKGYAATTVADVIGRAGVSRTTFYQQFKDKEDCFLVAYRKGADAQFRKVIEAVQTTTEPLQQLRRNLRAYLGELVAYPTSARAFLLEVAAAAELPAEVFRAAVAAVDELVVRWISEGRLAELDQLEPIAVYVELALFGVPDAVKMVEPRA